MTRLALLLPTIFVLLTGGATTDRIVLDGTKRAPTTNVDIYKAGERPKQSYKEIAQLSFLGPREDEFKATRHFISEGKKLGANAIVLGAIEEGGMRGGFNGYGGRFGSTFVFKATAIVYQ